MLPRCRSLLSLSTLLAVISCHEATAPQVNPEPVIRIESPVAGVVVGDSIVQLRGLAEAPGGIDWVEVTYGDANQTGNTLVLYRSDEHQKPDGTVEPQMRVPFDVPLRMYAGAKQVTMRMVYRLSQDEPYASPGHEISVSVAFRIWKKPALKLASVLPDTVYGRALSLVAASDGLDSNPNIDLVIDPGTPGERHVGGTLDWPGMVWPSGVDAGDHPVLFDLTDALPNGPHRVVLRLTDEMGPADSVIRNFITYLPTLGYTVSPLPGLGGTDSDALDVNAAGDVAGWAFDAGEVKRAVTWHDGTVTMLPTSSTSLSSQAYSLNDVGDIVGSVDDTVGTGHCARAIRWTTTTWRYVDVGRSLCDKSAMRVNAAGATLVAGASSWYGDTTAWLVHDSAVTYFQNVEPAQQLYPLGLSLNDRGEVAGAQRNDYGTLIPFSSGPTISRPTFRPPLNPGHPAGAILGINNASQAVGSYSGTLYFSPQPGSSLVDLNPYLLARSTPIALSGNGSVLAFDQTDHATYIWRGGRTYRVAVDADWVLDHVSAMNDAGVVTGHATQRSTGRTSAVILRP